METAGLLGATPIIAITIVFIRVFSLSIKALTTVLTTTIFLDAIKSDLKEHF